MTRIATQGRTTGWAALALLLAAPAVAPAGYLQRAIALDPHGPGPTATLEAYDGRGQTPANLGSGEAVLTFHAAAGTAGTTPPGAAVYECHVTGFGVEPLLEGNRFVGRKGWAGEKVGGPGGFGTLTRLLDSLGTRWSTASIRLTEIDAAPRRPGPRPPRSVPAPPCAPPAAPEIETGGQPPGGNDVTDTPEPAALGLGCLALGGLLLGRLTRLRAAARGR